MNKNNMADSSSGTSKLALLRQNRGVQRTKVDIGKAIDGFAQSIDDKNMMEDISRNSAIVNLIIDHSGSMDGTAEAIAQEINKFAARQRSKIYTTLLSLTLFDDSVSTEFSKVNARNFTPIYPWSCYGGTNIYDALFSAITPIRKTDANHKLHLLITDGQNGESRHTEEQVRELITNRIMEGDHVFLLFNPIDVGDSAKVYAKMMGINPNNAVDFSRNGDGIKIIFQTIEDLLDGLRTTGTVPNDWAKAIQAHAARYGIKARETKYLE